MPRVSNFSENDNYAHHRRRRRDIDRPTATYVEASSRWAIPRYNGGRRDDFDAYRQHEPRKRRQYPSDGDCVEERKRGNVYVNQYYKDRKHTLGDPSKRWTTGALYDAHDDKSRYYDHRMRAKEYELRDRWDPSVQPPTHPARAKALPKIRGIPVLPGAVKEEAMNHNHPAAIRTTNVDRAFIHHNHVRRRSKSSSSTNSESSGTTASSESSESSEEEEITTESDSSSTTSENEVRNVHDISNAKQSITRDKEQPILLPSKQQAIIKTGHKQKETSSFERNVYDKDAARIRQQSRRAKHQERRSEKRKGSRVSDSSESSATMQKIEDCNVNFDRTSESEHEEIKSSERRRKKKKSSGDDKQKDEDHRNDDSANDSAHLQKLVATEIKETEPVPEDFYLLERPGKPVFPDNAGCDGQPSGNESTHSQHRARFYAGDVGMDLSEAEYDTLRSLLANNRSGVPNSLRHRHSSDHANNHPDELVTDSFAAITEPLVERDEEVNSELSYIGDNVDDVDDDDDDDDEEKLGQLLYLFNEDESDIDAESEDGIFSNGADITTLFDEEQSAVLVDLFDDEQDREGSDTVDLGALQGQIGDDFEFEYGHDSIIRSDTEATTKEEERTGHLAKGGLLASSATQISAAPQYQHGDAIDASHEAEFQQIAAHRGCNPVLGETVNERSGEPRVFEEMQEVQVPTELSAANVDAAQHPDSQIERENGPDGIGPHRTLRIIAENQKKIIKEEIQKMSSENLPEFLNLRQRLQKRADGTGIDTGNIDLEAEFFLAETQSQDGEYALVDEEIGTLRSVQGRQTLADTLRKLTRRIGRHSIRPAPDDIRHFYSSHIHRYCSNEPHYCHNEKPCHHWPPSVRTRSGRKDVKFQPNEQNVCIPRRRGGILARLEAKEQRRRERYKLRRTVANRGNPALGYFMVTYFAVELSISRTWRRSLEYIQRWELFGGWLRKIEGEFGTVIYQYFLFARSLIFLNIICALAWAIFVIIPGSINLDENLSTFRADDILTAAGYFLNTTVYIGAYQSESVPYLGLSWDMPIAYMATTVGTLLLAMVSIVIIMIRRHFLSIVNQKDGVALYPFPDAVLCSWDYAIIKGKSRSLKQSQLTNQFKDLLKQKQEKPVLSTRDLFRLLSKRVALNGVISSLVTGFLFLLFWLSKRYADSTEFWEQMAAPLCSTIGSSLIPTIVYVLVVAQQFERATLTKVLVFWAFIIKLGPIYILLTSSLNLSNEPDIKCWETQAGVAMMQLLVLNLISTCFTTVLGDSARWVITYGPSCLRPLMSATGPPTFQMGKSTMDVIYSQALVWITSYFSPASVVFSVFMALLIFLVKLASLFKLLQPFTEHYVVRSDDNYSLTVLLVALFFCVIFIGYTILFMEPSQSCGPYRGLESAWDVIKQRVGTWPIGFQDALSFISSPAFVFPLLICLLVGLLYLLLLDNSAGKQTDTIRMKIDNQMLMKKRIVRRLKDQARRHLAKKKKVKP